jgi:hypothetical protein
MEDEVLAALQEEIMHDAIEAPAELEEQIKNTAEQAAQSLVFKPEGTTVEFLCPGEDEARILRMKILKEVKNFKQVVIMVIVDIRKYEEAKKRRVVYIPFTVTVEIDNSLSYQENLRATCEAFFRHISGAISPEVEEE